MYTGPDRQVGVRHSGTPDTLGFNVGASPKKGVIDGAAGQSGSLRRYSQNQVCHQRIIFASL
jgi:hypothetical protein